MLGARSRRSSRPRSSVCAGVAIARSVSSPRTSTRPRPRSATGSITTPGSAGPSARGHFPSETAALKCVYLAVMSLDPTDAGRKRWTTPESEPSKPGRFRQTHHSVGAHPPDQLDGQIPPSPGQGGDVVACVHDDRDVRSPGTHWPAATGRSATALNWAAVTAVASSSGPRRTTSSIGVHDVAPGRGETWS